MNAAVMHPPLEHLRRFVEGDLTAGLSVALAAHIESCEVCQRSREDVQSQVVANWDAAEVTLPQSDFPGMLDAIVRQPQEHSVTAPRAVTRDIVLDDHVISLPRALANIAAAGLNWKTVSNGIQAAEVELDSNTKCEFIYMQPGSKAPHHTHRGNEVMLVLDGVFRDEMGAYGVADFLMCDPNHRHQPFTETGCLCFSVLDGPLVFTQGWFRLWNPIGQVLFQLRQWFR